MSTPKPPAGTGPEGRRLWRSVLGEFDLNAAELSVLRQAVRLVDRCENLAAELERTGLAEVTAAGVRLNPLAAELRSCEIATARLLVCLRIPVGGVQQDDQEEPVAQYRGSRGVYSLGGAA